MVNTVRADLVCEGGGVRGIGLVGAVDALAAAPARWSPRWWRPCKPPASR